MYLLVMDWMFVFLSNSYVKALSPNVIILGDRKFGRKLTLHKVTIINNQGNYWSEHFLIWNIGTIVIVNSQESCRNSVGKDLSQELYSSSRYNFAFAITLSYYQVEGWWSRENGSGFGSKQGLPLFQLPTSFTFPPPLLGQK